MKKTKLIVIALSFIIFNSCLYTDKNIKIGSSVVKKIELYKKTNGYPPNWLQSIGYEEHDFLGIYGGKSICIADTSISGTSIIRVNGVLFCYERQDSVNYILWFGTTLGEGMYYYSDSQQWEKILRKIENND